MGITRNILQKKAVMKKIILCVAVAAAFWAVGCGGLIKDLDGDNIPDSVYFNKEIFMIVCKLSGSNFSEIRSKPIDNIYISNTKGGFEVRVVEHRAGYGNKFRYDPKSKRVRLIGMSRYEFGNAANDGSGESSVNLLTGL